MKKVLIRSDASTKVGAGHLMRSIALAQQLRKDGVGLLFMTVPAFEELNQYLRGQSFPVKFMDISAGQSGSDIDLAAILRETGTGYDWVVLDGYCFTSEFQKALQNAGTSLVFIEDRKDFSSPADLVVNAGTDPRFALIREELRALKKKAPKKLRNILVTLGGSRQPETLLKIVRALRRVEGSDFHVKVLGGFEQITPETGGSDHHEIEFLPASVENYKLYAWADLAICAAGGTAWELSYFQIPAVAGALSERQADFGETLGRTGAFVYLGWYSAANEAQIAESLKGLVKDPAQMELMRKKMAQLVDGKGAERIIRAMKEAEDGKVKAGSRRNA